MPNDLYAFLKDRYPAEFKVTGYEQDGKYHEVTLDFGDDEVLDLTLVENRNGYRIVCGG